MYYIITNIGLAYYLRAGQGTRDCSGVAAKEITSRNECKRAANYFNGVWIKLDFDTDAKPRNCFVEAGFQYGFNRHKTGGTKAAVSAVCKVGM